ncbi:MAG: HoxN/HupN/NixA family nickel/cobalt transporter [Gemmatimonadaceae bacterium]
MSQLLAASALGFLLGMRHATDPDHVAAVTTLVARHRSVRAAAAIGAVWALGHSLTILAVGGALVLFGWVIPPRLGLSMELSVGVMLVVLGITGLRSLVQDIRATALPVTAPAAAPVSLGKSHIARPFVVGVVHGLAGSAALALLVLALIGPSAWSLLYLVVFGVGTVVGMVLVTAAIGVPFAASGHRSAPLHRVLRAAAGVTSVIFGLAIAYRIAVVDGLFAAGPR